MIDIHETSKTRLQAHKCVMHILVQLQTYVLQFTSIKYVICEINQWGKNLTLVLNQTTKCSQYTHWTPCQHCTRDSSGHREGTWLPRPLSILFLSALGINSYNTISTKLPVTVSFFEIVTAVMVLNYSAFMWGDNPWFKVRLPCYMRSVDGLLWILRSWTPQKQRIVGSSE
jgi:hypothetical protein